MDSRHTKHSLTLCMMYLHNRTYNKLFCKADIKEVQYEQMLVQRTNPQEKTVTNSL